MELTAAAVRRGETPCRNLETRPMQRSIGDGETRAQLDAGNSTRIQLRAVGFGFGAVLRRQVFSPGITQDLKAIKISKNKTAICKKQTAGQSDKLISSCDIKSINGTQNRMPKSSGAPTRSVSGCKGGPIEGCVTPIASGRRPLCEYWFAGFGRNAVVALEGAGLAECRAVFGEELVDGQILGGVGLR